MSRLDYAQARAEMSGIPRGVGAPPPPGMDTKRGKLMCIKVRMLDDSVAVFHLGHKALGQTLLEEVSRHLNLLENDYFGLEFIDSMNNRCWLDKDKPILRQITATNSDAKFYFIVKFYTPNPIDLEEEYTRYLITLQIRRDLSLGELHCAESTAALLAAYLVQSDCGDFSSEDYRDATYLSHSRFVPGQTLEFQQKVMENHRNLIGMSPGESDLALLEVARRCDFYGIKFHPAKDIEGTQACLSVMHLGIKVFHQLHCVSTFSWAKIRKLSFKRRKLLIKLHPDSHQYYKETIEFVFDTRNECKNFWKKCVEHHAFFRCTQSDAKKDGKLFSKGSSFRYNGRTQKQLIDYVREHHKRREPFTRPLRSAGALRGYSSGGYSTVSDRRREERRNHTLSMPHLAHSSAETEPTLRRKKKEVIYGVNSTFSSEDVSTIERPHRIPLSTSLTSNVDSARCLIRGDSSDSGGISIYQDTKQNNGHNNNNGMTVSFSQNGLPAPPLRLSTSLYSPLLISPSSTFLDSIPIQSGPIPMIPPVPSLLLPGQSWDPVERQLEPETSSEQSEYYLEKEDSIVGKRSYLKPQSSMLQIVKDFIAQERTVKRDLKLISKTFFLKVEPLLSACRILNDMFSILTDLLNAQIEFLEDIDKMLASTGSSSLTDFPNRLLRSAHNAIPMYSTLLQQYPIFISAIDELAKSNVAFRAQVVAFESSEECYLPINWLLLRIAQRMVTWKPVLARIVEQQLEDGRSDSEMTSSRISLEKISVFEEKSEAQREKLAEYVALLQIAKDVGSNHGTLPHPNRRIIRVGWVERWSDKGLSPRVMLLTSDRLLFAYRTNGEAPFTFHLEIRLKGLLVEEGDTYRVIGGRRNDVITLHSGQNSIVFATPAKEAWLEDLSSAVKSAAKCRLELPSLHLDRVREDADDDGTVNRSKTDESQRKASPLMVCWHRHTSIGVEDIHRIVSVSQSGYLLRKLRNSSGWQRLWVVLAGHTLYFYKTHEDLSPLANLPLIDYGLGIPSIEDLVEFENCFKLFYAAHKYFFRADSLYTFNRWIDAIRHSAISRKHYDIVTSLSIKI